ncbi:Pimeloyl-ACP methyl ester carboxylesterase [Hymenobacter daecheongensis DSM 21074]|uniref:Pimeloyl-ACP methyl ester carboxylesterase n=1 Tax=Hymenobacter daecheongensis DSM 21074 TaxID=1121955 RepID=A0A1M6AMB6_9BACT|nr:alpha/beta hydrolase [Hymenobacter daecheongensis]SHI37478.1 Pimeloyl-ACP methyl ester carboxylesterase [Hymenobacter daecheongensis DSM 21074]
MPAPAPLTFVCLHYWAGSGREWQAIADLLAPEYQVLAPDLSGFGAAPPPTADYSVAAYADQIIGLVQEHKLTRYVLVGHSMGGKIALAVAARRPAGLLGLVLLNPSPPSPEPMTDADRHASLRAWGKPAEAEKTFRRILTRPVPAAAHAQVVADNLRATKAAWEAWMLHGSREDITARLGSLPIPCLIIAGGSDPIMSPSVHGLETLPHLPEGTPLEIIPGAGHLLPYEAPTEVAELLRAFGEMVR